MKMKNESTMFGGPVPLKWLNGIALTKEKTKNEGWIEKATHRFFCQKYAKI